MGDTSVLILMIAATLGLMTYMERLPAFRRFAGFRDIRRVTRKSWAIQAAGIRVMPRAGDRGAQTLGHYAIFESLSSVRLAVPLLLGLSIAGLLLSGMQNSRDLIAMTLCAGGGLWWSYYVWVYRIVLDGFDLHIVDWRLRCRRFDLTQLVRAEDDTNGGFRLEFADGQHAYLMKHVHGADALRDMIVGALMYNER